MKFFTSSASALAAEPSKPQGFDVRGQLVSPSAQEAYNPKLTWIPNIESDVNDLNDPQNAPGSYEIWRRSGITGAWSQIASVNGSVDSYVDGATTLYPGSGGTVYHRLRAVDAQGKTSVYTEEDYTSGPSLPYKISANSSIYDVRQGLSISMIMPNPAREEISITYEVWEPGVLSLELVYPLGQVVDRLNLGECS